MTLKTMDLGQLDGPVLIFGGAYSNLQALEALINRAQTLGIGADNCICTGDVVAYCANPSETIDLIRDFGCPVLAGNCEKQLATGEDDCGCGFEAGSTCSLLSVSWYRHANYAVRDDQRVWMAGLPDRIVFTHSERKYGVVHGAASDIACFVWPVASDAQIRSEIDLLKDQVGQVDNVIAGHTGIAMNRQIDGKRWLNSGAIGMPANVGETTTSYAVLENGEFSIQRLDYDHLGAARAMEQAGLTQGYHQTLVDGFWPSEETLPPEMRHPASG